MDIPRLLLHWGKSEEDGHGKHTDRYYPTVLHMLDAGCMGIMLYRYWLHPKAKAILRRNFGMSEEECGRFVGWVIAAHDLGKISWPFESQAMDLLRSTVGEVPDYPIRKGATESDDRHANLTASSLWWELKDTLLAKGLAGKALYVLASILSGHHGEFSVDFAPLPADQRSWMKDRKAGIELFVELFGMDGLLGKGVLSSATRSISSNSAIILATLVCLSDWIVSDKDYMEFRKPAGYATIDHVWLAARKEALLSESDLPKADWNEVDRLEEIKGMSVDDAKKLDKLKTKPLGKMKYLLNKRGFRDRPGKMPGRTFKDIFGANFIPNPLQNVCDRVARSIPKGAQFMVIIEAPPGTGKTEGAMWIALKTDLRRGFYWALPTMATSDQMMKRCQRFLEKALVGKVSVQLAHSHKILNMDFKKLKGHKVSYGSDNEGECTANEWMFSSKRSLLAPFGVGTEDQELLGCIRSKHWVVRNVGMFGKTGIDDEAHAYDCYTSTLMESSLAWRGKTSGSSIILSATLPEAKKMALVSAFLGMEVEDLRSFGASYPGVTLVIKQGRKYKIRNFPVPLGPSDRYDIGIRLAPGGYKAAVDVLDEHAAEGGCLGIVCVTIDHSIETAEMAKKKFGDRAEIILLHGRMPYFERQKAENRVKEVLGKDAIKDGTRPGMNGDKRLFIVVSTQILEQSLDLDFDLLVSELSPMDLLIQRLGRMRRFMILGLLTDKMRPEPLRKAKFVVMTPVEMADGTLDYEKCEKIYYQYLLDYTKDILTRIRKISIPEDVPKLVDEVYQKIDSADAIRWTEKYHEMLMADMTHKATAWRRVIPANLYDAADFLGKVSGPMDDDDDATRLEEVPTLQGVCLRQIQDGRIMTLDGTLEIPPDKWNESYANMKWWISMLPTLFMNQCRIPLWFSKESPMETPNAWKKVPLLRNSVMIIFSEPNMMHGKLLYRPGIGITLEK